MYVTLIGMIFVFPFENAWIFGQSRVPSTCFLGKENVSAFLTIGPSFPLKKKYGKISED